MKLEGCYYNYEQAAWLLHYIPHIPYRKLKSMLKAAKLQGKKLPEDFFSGFLQAISTCHLHAGRRQSIIAHESAQLSQISGSSGRRERYGDICIDQINSVGLKILQKSMTELAWFYRLNLEAVVRICNKINRYHLGPIPTDIQSEIDKQLRNLDDANTRLAAWLDRAEADIKDVIQIPDDAHELSKSSGQVAAILREWYRSHDADMMGHTPLHFGIVHELEELVRSELDRMQNSVATVENSLLQADKEGLSLMHWCVFRASASILDLLLSKLESGSTLPPDDLLYVALRRENDAMVRLLINKSIGLNYVSSTGENCLHTAAELGRKDYLDLLLPAIKTELINGKDLDRGWTPLTVACARGRLSLVERLINAGAIPDSTDYLGWTTLENAVFRGHLEIGQILNRYRQDSQPLTPLPHILSKRNKVPRFGIKPGYPHVILNLGGLQNMFLSKTSVLELSTGVAGYHRLRLSVSLSNSPATYERVLPLLDDPVDDTFVFPYDSGKEPIVSFKITRLGTDAGDRNATIGTGMTFLDGLHILGRHRSLIREHTIPIMGLESLEPIGSITFSALVATPHLSTKNHILQTPTASFEALENSRSVELVGHRGVGANSRKRHLQLGENTIESFLTAGKLGASFVEFDVQVTRDEVPVLFHDFSLSQTGTDVPVYDVTLDQFRHASNIQPLHGNPPSMLGESNDSARGDLRHRKRSRSITNSHEKDAEEVQNRMKFTVDFEKRGFKSNTRGEFVQDTFATLEEVLRDVPEEVGFDIELKYQRVHEAVGADIAPIALDINLFVDRILEKIAACTQNRQRKIVLSSFTPEICILLSLKQKAYPILFITNAGKRPIIDHEKRAGSLQVAVRFVKKWGLDGLVVAADSFIMCPRLLGYIKSQGLVCGSYNTLNDVPENIEIQVKAGLDLIVADRVKLVSQVLENMDLEPASLGK